MASTRKLKQLSNYNKKSINSSLPNSNERNKPKLREWGRQVIEKIQRLYVS